MLSKKPAFTLIEEDSDLSDSEYGPLYDDTEELNQRTAQETKGWNLFREFPVKHESGSMVSASWAEMSIKLLKLLAYIIVFALVLGAAVVSKGTVLFITSQLKKDRQFAHCNRQIALDQQFTTVHSLEERVGWLWAAFLVFSFPEVAIFLRSARMCFFKTIVKPSTLHFILALIIETLHTIGIALLILVILPELDVVKGAMLMNAFCIIPGILNAVFRDPADGNYILKLSLDVLAVSAQVTAFIVWPLLEHYSTVLWTIPFACLFISLGWWENYVGHVDLKSSSAVIFLHSLRRGLKDSRYYSHMFLSLWKIGVFLLCIMVSSRVQGDDPLSFFNLVSEAFSDRTYIANEVQIMIQDSYNLPVLVVTDEVVERPVYWPAALWVALIQILTAYVCFMCAKFACKIYIQNFSFTFALTLAVPVSINILLILAGLKNADPCAFHNTIPDYLFFHTPPIYTVGEYFGRQFAWVWLLWAASQAWILVHTWWPRCERLAATDKLFAKPWYSGAIVDSSLLMNRSHDDNRGLTLNDLKDLEEDKDDNPYFESMNNEGKDIKPSDSITRIYICATMWHETKDEMMEFLKSLFRLDEDQSARRVAQKYLGIVDSDYYELESHIFLDDGFEVTDHSHEDSQVNRFVKCLVETIDEAASEVHLTNMRLRPPKKYPTPYGGRLVWNLPGKTKLICHLKDKNKIRHKKRWSQVMYMYYFLGHRLMNLPISVFRKEVIAENTYLLALDGDIDFQPSAVTLLIDLMKKDKNLGAACGRIHPVGSGFMAWYQMFEYAIGHWLQKATEHMIGCVLCSPGCFSLFRGKALMDDNVMRKYTLTSSEARHFVQYDQGEDRWLCTLLLQRGYRVEYSAASDAYTHCPENFGEFFNQRRRWVPSTMANILDLLSDSKRTVKINDSISTLYIIYQFTLMIGTVLGPGTIFLMLVGALNSITGISVVRALLINLIPITIFIIICMTRKSETQLFVATVITCLYAMLMMVVIIGIVLQIAEDGWLAPSSIFTIATFSIFFITAALHPQEIKCLLYLVVYYITIPSMYMLLIIYSLCNLNNVSWGTREAPQKKTLKDIEKEKKEAEEAKKEIDKQSLSNWLGKKPEEKSGSLECGVAGLFRCICCSNPADHKDDLHLVRIANSLQKIESKVMTSENQGSDIGISRRASGIRGDGLSMLPEDQESVTETDVPREDRDRDGLINPYWIEDPNLQKGEVDFLTTAENEFWKDLIDAYLQPIEEDEQKEERIKNELKDLRDKMVFAFLMINALFVLVIFLLQLNQDQIHLQWPWGQRVEVSYDGSADLVTIQRDYLMLEPIGLLFLVFFGFVMTLQFTAMFLHRFATLTHLLSTVHLNWYCFRKPADMSDKTLIEKRAVEIAKEMQRFKGDGAEEEEQVGARRTLYHLERSKDQKQSGANLDVNFKRRLTMLGDDPNGELARMSSLGATEESRRVTLRALQLRRSSVLAEKRRSQMLQQGAQGAVFHYETPRTTINGLGRSSYMNGGYEPATDSEDDSIRAPRRSTVRFRESFT